jgi:antitoxin VapB
MKTASLFKNGRNQAVRLPKEFEFSGVSEVEIIREGDAIILKPVRKSWTSFSEVEKADDDFLSERENVIEDRRE